MIEGDIKACFDNVNHGALLELLRQRVEDKKVISLLKACLKSGVIKETGRYTSTITGTPQGGIISPLLANVYLSVLDRHFEQAWQSQTRSPGLSTRIRRQGHPTYRLIRYADDFVVLLFGAKAHAKALREQIAILLREKLRMELSLEKTLVTHVDEGFDFLGHTVRRRPYKGSWACMTYPSKKSLNAIKDKVRAMTSRSTLNQSLRVLLMKLNPVLRGWSNYFRYDAAKRCLAYVDYFAWQRVFRWLRKKHPKRTVQYLRQRYCNGRWRISEGGIELVRPSKVRVERYRFRGTRIYPTFVDLEESMGAGRYARSPYDDPERMGWLDEILARPTVNH